MGGGWEGTAFEVEGTVGGKDTSGIDGLGIGAGGKAAGFGSLSTGIGGKPVNRNTNQLELWECRRLKGLTK